MHVLLYLHNYSDTKILSFLWTLSTQFCLRWGPDLWRDRLHFIKLNSRNYKIKYHNTGELLDHVQYSWSQHVFIHFEQFIYLRKWILQLFLCRVLIGSGQRSGGRSPMFAIFGFSLLFNFMSAAAISSGYFPFNFNSIRSSRITAPGQKNANSSKRIPLYDHLPKVKLLLLLVYWIRPR